MAYRSGRASSAGGPIDRQTDRSDGMPMCGVVICRKREAVVEVGSPVIAAAAAGSVCSIEKSR
jgi:hypothetical protein